MLENSHCIRILYMYLYRRSAILLLLVLNLPYSSSYGACLFGSYVVYSLGVSSILCPFWFCPITSLALKPRAPFSKPFLSYQTYLHSNYIFKSTVNISIHISNQYISITINIWVMPQNLTKLSKVK